MKLSISILEGTSVVVGAAGAGVDLAVCNSVVNLLFSSMRSLSFGSLLSALSWTSFKNSAAMSSLSFLSSTGAGF